MKISLGSMFGIALFTAALGGCAADAHDDAVAADESELQEFSPAERAGTIARDQTLTITHGGGPSYRVLSFDAAAGETVQLRVQAFGRDAVLWLLDAQGNTVQQLDATRDGEDEELTYVATTARHMQLAIREKSGRPTSFIVSMHTIPAIAAGVPACAGTPRFPEAGSRNAFDIVRIELASACSDCGFVEVGRKSLPYGAIRVDSTRYLSVDAPLRQEAIADTDVTYDCLTSDTGSATLDGSGAGTSSMHESRRCVVRGGSGGPTEERGFRPGKATMGDGCVTIVDDDRGSSLHRFVYSAKY